MPGNLSDDDLIDIANQVGLPGYHALALADKENSNDDSVSGAGARGRFQLLPSTFYAVNPTGDISNPRDNAVAGMRYYKQGLDKNDQDPAAAAAYYYAGPGWKNKIQKAPGAKYGTNPDGSGGISIEDYSNQFVKNIKNYAGEDQPITSVAHVDDANYLSDDLNSSIAKVSLGMNTQLEKVGAASETLSTRIKDNVSKQMDNLSDQGNLEANIILDKWGQQAKQAGEASAELSRLGINTSDLDSTIAELSVQLNQNYKEAQAMREDIRQKQNTSFFDSPIDWIGNQLTLPSEIRQHNQIIEDMASKKQYVDQATNIAANVQAVNAAKFTTVSFEGAQAAAQLAKTKASEAAIKLEDSMLRTDFETQVRTLQIMQTRMNIESQIANREENQARRRTADEAKAAEQDRIQNDNNQVNVAGKILGLDIPDRKSLDKIPKDVKNAVEYIMANGGGIGKDPLEALQVLKRGNPSKMGVITQQQLNLLSTAYSQASDLASKSPEVRMAKPEQQRAFIAGKMQDALNLAASDPNYTGLKNNPYKIPSLDTMQQLPEIANSRIVALATQFRKDFPQREITDSQLFELAKANIGPTKAYTDMSDAAKDIAKYYQAGVKINNEKVRFNAFGMKDQEDYLVKLPGSNTKKDMTSYTSLMQHFLATDRGNPAFFNIARDLGS